MGDVQLSWTNKELVLSAAGSEGYQWLVPSDPILRRPLEILDLELQPDCAIMSTNVLAIGDGRDVMEALDSASGGSLDSKGIRLLYIDPPFNTGKAFVQYGDSLQSAMWLSMLYDRLESVRKHLRDDASIWVHLDDNQIHHARMVLDEVFGPEAFVTTVIWQKRTTRESRSAFSTNHDSILVYAPAGPKAWKTSRNLLRKDQSHLRNRDNDPRGPWGDAPFTAPGFRANQQYPITTPSGKILFPPRGRSWYATEDTYKRLLREGRIWFPKDGDGSPRLKLFSHQLRGLVPFSVWDSSETGTNDEAKRHLMSLFPEKEAFDTPKPETLLHRIIHVASNPGDLVVDLFAGSGTTGAVAQKMGRSWLLAERLPSVALGYTLPRLQAVVSGKDRGGVSPKTLWTGGGDLQIIVVPPRIEKERFLADLQTVKKVEANEGSGRVKWLESA